EEERTPHYTDRRARMVKLQRTGVGSLWMAQRPTSPDQFVHFRHATIRGNPFCADFRCERFTAQQNSSTRRSQVRSHAHPAIWQRWGRSVLDPSEVCLEQVQETEWLPTPRGAALAFDLMRCGRQ